jgi:hypothetical protein
VTRLSLQGRSAMPDPAMTPEFFRTAAKSARERAAVTTERGLRVAYQLLAKDYEALASSLEMIKASKKSLGDV